VRQFTDTAFVLRAFRHGEDGAVMHAFTQNHGRVAGYLPRLSERVKALAVAGTHVQVEWQSKNQDGLGFFQLEEDTNLTVPVWVLPETGVSAWQSAIQILDMVLPERQELPNLYSATQTLAGFLSETDLLPIVYVQWELGLLRELGYGLNLEKCVASGSTDKNTFTHVSPKSGGVVSQGAALPLAAKLLPLPKFILGDINPPPTAQDIQDGLDLAGYFIAHRVLYPLSKNLPDARQKLV
jgi:DNA repair protein RecO (recombination protein O)